MAKITAPLLSLLAFGTLAKNLTFRRHKRRVYAEKKPHPIDANTAAQAPQRLKFQDAIDWWHFLGPTEQAAYDKPGREHHMSGYAWFIRTYLLNPWPATFLSLTDVPDTYVGEAGHSPKVNAGETALDWSTIKEHASGIVDIPSQSRCLAYRTADQTVISGPWTKVELNQETFDTQGEFDHVTNYRFTATQAGYYLVTAITVFASLLDAEGVFTSIYKGGAGIAICENKAAAVGTCTNTLATITYLGIGDYLELFVLQLGAGNRIVLGSLAHCQMAIHKLS